LKIGKFSFTCSQIDKSNVVVFDREGSEVLGKFVLRDIPHFVLCSRQELIYFNPRVVIFFLKNVLRLYHDPLSLGTLHRIYLLSCIEILAPKIILTFIDNSYDFQWIARHYSNGKCYAVQNGMRLSINLTKWLPAAPHPASKIYLPNFLCFGNFEKDMYRYYGHEIDRFHPVGSLRGGYYLNRLRSRRINQRFDICLISEWDPGLQDNPIFPEIGQSIVISDNYVSRYAKMYDVKICIATRSPDGREIEYFSQIFGERAVIIKNDRETMSTYRAIDESNVSVTAFSTAGVEAFGWGKKILFCNFTGHKDYALPVPDICSIDKPDFETFCAKINFLLSIDPSKFMASAGKSARYMMNYNEAVPAHLYLQRIVHDEIDN
jgi:surface carbohydrate biosynthesis protein